MCLGITGRLEMSKAPMKGPKGSASLKTTVCASGAVIDSQRPKMALARGCVMGRNSLTV